MIDDIPAWLSRAEWEWRAINRALCKIHDSTVAHVPAGDAPRAHLVTLLMLEAQLAHMIGVCPIPEPDKTALRVVAAKFIQGELKAAEL